MKSEPQHGKTGPASQAMGCGCGLGKNSNGKSGYVSWTDPFTMSYDALSWYGTESPPLREKLALDSAACTSMVSQHLGNDVELARRLLDVNYALACHYMWFMDAPHIAVPSDRSNICVAAFHKSLLMLSASIDQTERGFYGATWPLLRHTYEYLMIAKFCSISSNDHVHSNWKNKKTVYFTNSILKKIRSPDITPLTNLWGELNDLTHATRYSAQAELNFPNIAKNIQVNLALIQVMADWMAYILTKHIITPEMKRAAKKYTLAPGELAAASANLTVTLAVSKERHSIKSQQLIQIFRKKWILDS